MVSKLLDFDDTALIEKVAMQAEKLQCRSVFMLPTLHFRANCHSDIIKKVKQL
jgi:hypothetical protein